MVYEFILLLSLLNTVVASPILIKESVEEHGYGSYDGPPAPLNPDGSVAFTEEYERIRDEHLAAHEREYQRIKADLDEIGNDSAQDQSSNAYGEEEGSYNPEIYERVPYLSAEVDDGQYDSVEHEKRYMAQYDDGTYRPKYSKRVQNDNVQYRDSPSAEDASSESAEK